MSKRFIGLAASLALLAGIAAASRALAQPPIKMTIVGPGSTAAPIALSQLKNGGGDDQHRISSVFIERVARNLVLSGLFRIIDPHAYIEDPQKSGYDLGQFNFGDWSSINAEFLVKGLVRDQGGSITLEALLFDVPGQRRLMGKRFTGSADDVPEMARRLTDALLKATTGVQGPFDSKLAYVSNRGRFKQVYTAFVDGGQLFQVTNNPTINLFPSLDRSARHLLYTSYKAADGTPALYLANLERKRELRITSPHGQMIGGAVSPDGTKIAAAITRAGHTNLYLLDAAGAEVQPLTSGDSINVAPAFSPDGSKIAFTSDRSSTPQIWVMNAGAGARRLTYRGDYNTNPAFSPGGDRIAYQSRQRGRFQIYVISAAGGEPTRLSDGEGSDQSPAWSPDGRYIAFSSTRGGRAHIYLMQVSTRKVISALTEGNGDDTNPAWSGWLVK